jgi:BirA family biotin operon repressor/biotin-[acetyl-CoA-carboxylase] ligase
VSTAGASAPPVLRLATVDSTQRVAFDAAREGAADGTVVLAEHQTAGRGRRGRRWDDEPGQALLLSIVLRPSRPLAEWPRLSFASALAVAGALERVAGLPARLRWPNDVLVGGRKIAGILLEARDGVLVIGIGLNVGQREFPPALTDRATSVLLESGRPVNRDRLLDEILAGLSAWRAPLDRGEFGPVRQAWLERTETLGREIAAGGHAGVAVGLDDDGALLVRDAAGVHRVTAGAVDDPPA